MPSEHTALLNRDERELIEKEFKANQDYNTKLYKNPIPLTDEEKSRAKWRNGRRYLNY